MATKLKIKCADDDTEWEITWDAAKSSEKCAHDIKIADPDGPKGALAAWMACSHCGKNHDHDMTLSVEE